jgi:hypothetical protein
MNVRGVVMIWAVGAFVERVRLTLMRLKIFKTMKTRRTIEQEIDVATIRIEVAVRYEEEDIPNDFPFRDGSMWCADVDMDTGKITDWPQGKAGTLSMKVCDQGTYTLFDRAGNELARLENDYCPNRVVPGEYGDYINLEIDATGTITNWIKKPDFGAFFE